MTANGSDVEDGLTGSIFLELSRIAADPSSSSSLSSDQLASRLGIDGLPTKEDAIALLETEVLAPVRDLSDPELSAWQM